MTDPTALLRTARTNFHAKLLGNVLKIDSQGNASNADKSNGLSVRIARGIAEKLKSETGSRLAGQTSGSQFEGIVADFLQATFPSFQHIRPGSWKIEKLGNRNRLAIAQYEQYAHLVALESAARKDRELAAALGSDYTITPDVIIVRELMDDEQINLQQRIVDGATARRASIRLSNGGNPLLHASISIKWTIRSDRSQNSRSEALNLIRNRKGHLPHIAVVTAEPLPSRLASIALGTGDIDCVYHFALDELLYAAADTGAEDAVDLLNIMISGKRLKDISDLPLDLAV